ncbi:MAG: hypothetical protein ABI680_08930 [Chthoniobacteraceae bacterium]
MNLLSIVFLVSLVIVLAMAVVGLRQPRHSPARIIAVVGVCVILIGVTLFCVFGFLASSEIEAEQRPPWRVGFIAAGIGALGGAAALTWREMRGK